MSKYDLGIQDLAHQAGVLIDAIKLLHRNENVATKPMDDATRASSIELVQNAVELLEEMKTVLDPEYTLALRYIGCCSVDYLTDHLNGDSEELISIDIQTEMTHYDIELALITELENLSKYPRQITGTKQSELTSELSKSAEMDLQHVKDCLEEGEELPDDARLWFGLTW